MQSLCTSSNPRKAGSQLFPGNVRKILPLSATYCFLLWPIEISDNPQANNMSKGKFWSPKMAGSSGTEQNQRYFWEGEGKGGKAWDVGVCYRMTLSVVEVDKWSLSTEKSCNESYRITLLYSGKDWTSVTFSAKGPSEDFANLVRNSNIRNRNIKSSTCALIRALINQIQNHSKYLKSIFIISSCLGSHLANIPLYFEVLLTVHLSIFIVLLTVHLSIFVVLLTVHLSIFIVLLTVHLSIFIVLLTVHLSIFYRFADRASHYIYLSINRLRWLVGR